MSPVLWARHCLTFKKNQLTLLMEFQMGVNTKNCVYLVLHFYLEVKIFFFFLNQ